jgi:hypothetical protein
VSATGTFYDNLEERRRKGEEQLVKFLYILLRDHVPTGAVEGIIEEHVRKSKDKRGIFSSKHLEGLATDMARDILGVKL